MKRSKPLMTSGVRYGRVTDNLTLEQLALIGAVALTFNEAEDHINTYTGHVIGVQFDPIQVVSRINGFDGKIELIKLAAKEFGCTGEEMTAIEECLGNGGFMLVKQYRDAVVHARLFDAGTSVAKVNERRGKRAEVLLSVEALSGLLQRMEIMANEISELLPIISSRHLLMAATDDHKRSRILECIQDAMARYHQYRSQRLALAPLPEFPAQPDIHVLPNWSR